MARPNHKRNIKVTGVRERQVTEQERKVARALIALARTQLVADAETLADEVDEAASLEREARKAAVREHRARRAERRGEASDQRHVGGTA